MELAADDEVVSGVVVDREEEGENGAGDEEEGREEEGSVRRRLRSSTASSGQPSRKLQGTTEVKQGVPLAWGRGRLRAGWRRIVPFLAYSKTSSQPGSVGYGLETSE